MKSKLILTGLFLAACTEAPKQQPLPPSPDGPDLATPSAADLTGVTNPSVDLAAVAPTFTSVNPKLAPTQTGATITVAGSGFNSRAQVFVNNLAAPITSISDTQIVFKVPPQPRGQVGPAAILVRNPDGTSQINSNVANSPTALRLFSSQPSFAPRTELPVDSNPVALDIGDIDNDGKLDFMFTAVASNTVGFYLGNGTGTFQRYPIQYNLGQPYGQAYHARLVDWNNDKKLDFVTASLTSGGVSTYLQQANGTFSNQANSSYGSTQRAVAVGDLSGDGIPDFVMINNPQNVLYTFIANTNGGFSNTANYNASSQPYRVVLGDVSGDGKLDAVAVNNTNGVSTLSVFIGSGNGNAPFTGPSNYGTNAANQGPQFLVLADMTNDGKLDAIVSNVNTNNVSIFLGAGAAANTFGNRTDVNVGTNPYGLATGDFNGDGSPDFVVANNTLNTISLLLGDGNGNFPNRFDFQAGNGPFWISSADLNGDNLPDLLVTNQNSNTISIHLNSSQ